MRSNDSATRLLLCGQQRVSWAAASQFSFNYSSTMIGQFKLHAQHDRALSSQIKIQFQPVQGKTELATTNPSLEELYPRPSYLG